METTREIALRTYKDATEHGMMDSPMNWHIWKRAFDTAERELKNLQLGAVSGRSKQFNCGKERVFGEKRCNKQCDDCLKEYGGN